MATEGENHKKENHQFYWLAVTLEAKLRFIKFRYFNFNLRVGQLFTTLNQKINT